MVEHLPVQGTWVPPGKGTKIPRAAKQPSPCALEPVRPSWRVACPTERPRAATETRYSQRSEYVSLGEPERKARNSGASSLFATYTDKYQREELTTTTELSCATHHCKPPLLFEAIPH